MNEFACQLGALSADEQNRRAVLFANFKSAVVDVVELDNGYEVAVSDAGIGAEQLQQLIAFERRCCSFLEFELAESADSQRIRITGGEGVKAFLESEFELK